MKRRIVSLLLVLVLLAPVMGMPGSAAELSDFSPENNTAFYSDFIAKWEVLQSEVDVTQYAYYATVYNYGTGARGGVSVICSNEPFDSPFSKVTFYTTASNVIGYHKSELYLAGFSSSYLALSPTLTPSSSYPYISVSATYFVMNHSNTVPYGLEPDRTCMKNYVGDDVFTIPSVFTAVNIWETLPVVDTTRLEQLIAQANQLSESGYTPASWVNLQTVLQEAQALLESDGLTQAAVDEMCDWLEAAINALVIALPDTSELERLLREAEAIEDIGYTTYSWSRLTTAIYNGRSLLAQTTYTAVDVNIATTNLRNAMSGLTLLAPDPGDGDHRYLIDGIRPQDLLPAEDAIMENFREARKFGLYTFIVMLVVFILVRIITSFLDIQIIGPSIRYDMGHPERHEEEFVRDRKRRRR